MRKTFLSKIKRILEEEGAAITRRGRQNPTIDIDIDGDETDEIQGKILALATAQLVARDKEKMNKILNAMKKINDGSFGYCEECGEEIAEKRLLANPGAVTCISCAEQIEIIEKRNRI